MNDLIKIVVYERNSLLKGWVISTLLVLPFTFLPTVIKYGLSIEAIRFRLSDSILYSLGFSLIVVVAAVIHNYNNLVDRKRLFDKQTFKELDFYGRLDGVGSIVRELETFLLGKIGNYYFRINLIEPELNTNKIEIVPLIETKSNKELEKKLKDEFGFRNHWFFGKEIKLLDEQINDKSFLKNVLNQLALDLKNMGAKPLEIDEFELENE